MSGKLVISIGNPDKEYQETYHNVGHMLVALLAETQGVAMKNHKKSFRLGTIGSGAFLAQSLLYMNESGLAVKEAAAYCRVDPENILLVHDDGDIALGTVKIAFARGAAGHHGVESAFGSLGSKNFWRLRIGIRSPLPHRRKTGDFVLQKITGRDRDLLYSALSAGAEETMKWIENDKPCAVTRISVSGNSMV